MGGLGKSSMNDFHKDLEYSLSLRDDEQFNDFYRATFLQVERIELCEDMERQHKGIDKVIYFENGNSITIDEKKRRKDYGDILLELWKNKARKRLGWLFYSYCDYIVYAIPSANKIYLLPTALLQAAWKRNGKQWLRSYELKEAQNNGYITVNIPIPTDILLNCIQREIDTQLRSD